MMGKGVKRAFGLVGMLSLLVVTYPRTAEAALLSTWSWSGTVSGGTVSGQASFSVVADGGGWDLVIDMSNTAIAAPVTTAQVLTGLYFDTNSVTGALTMLSAFATNGLMSAVSQTSPDGGSTNANICAPGHGGTAPTPACGVTVPGGWEAAYGATGLNGGAVAQHWGIGTSGQSGVFNGNNTTGVGNANYGIAPGNGVGDGTGGGLSGMLPYTYAAAEFTLTGLTTDQITISNVLGTYGTLPEGTPAGVNITPTPEPASLAILVVSCIGLASARRNRRAKGSPYDLFKTPGGAGPVLGDAP
jgi:hypothetical protein